MKKVISILALGLALLMVSCQKENTSSGSINEITDLYTVPADAVPMAELTASKSTWSTDRRYFDLTFGSALSTTLVGYDALLAPGQYVLGGDEKGNAILAKTKLNGQAAKEGYITVGKLPDGKYAITAHIDGEILTWTGTLPFVPDPAPVALSVVMDAKANAGEVTTLTLNLATEGISQEFDMTTYQNVWKGEGGYLALDLNTGDKYLVDGNYKACAVGGVVNTGEFGIGYDTDVEYWGTVYHVENWGTCWWDVKDGAATATKITDGLVTVSSREESVEGKDVTIWTIFWGKNYPKEYVFEGAIPALTKPKKPAGPVAPTHKYTIGEPQACMLSDNTTVVEGVKKYPFTITDANDNEVAYLEFVLVDGANDVTPGDYVSTEYAHEVGQLANGYYLDFGEWGVFAGGSYYWAGEEKVYIGAGETVSVAQIGTGAFEFISTGFDFPAAGPNYVPEEGGEGDMVTLTKFANKTDYTGWGMNMIALEFCTDGLTPTAGFFGATYAGDGNYLKLEIYAESGNGPAAGTYVPNTVGTDDVPAGTFKAGYDPEGGKDYGTNWFTVVGGAGTSAHITDGTVTVSVDGDTYTIVVESTAVKCKYVGPLQ